MATTYNNSTTNANYLAAKTGLAPSVAAAWLANEGQSVANPTNPLNIVKGGTPNQTGSSGGFGTYASPTAGLDAAAWLLKANSAYQGILNAIKSGTPIQQAQAIQNSPWAAGHYSYSNISSMVGGASTPGGGASTPITPAVTASTNTNPPSSTGSMYGVVLNGQPFTAADVQTMLSTTDKLNLWTDAVPLLGSGARTSWEQLLTSYIGQPKTSALASSMQSGTFTTASANNPLGGLKIPDVQTAITFLAIILVGIAFLGLGGLIALRKKA